MTLILVGLGTWQLQRMTWKTGVLASLSAGRNMPLLDAGAGPLPEGLEFRHVRLIISCPEQEPYGKIGYAPDGRTGYSVVLRCHAGAEMIEVDAGWGPRPDSWKQASGLWKEAAPTSGILIASARDNIRYQLVVDTAPAPLLPSTPPIVENIPNNHFAYAMQWYGFALMLVVIWGVYVHRWRNPRNLALPETDD